MHATIDQGRQLRTVTHTDNLHKPATVTTTFYDLMTALQDRCGPGNDDLIVSLVASWLLSGHITFHGRSLLASDLSQRDV
jgi:hypothetical protein